MGIDLSQAYNCTRRSVIINLLEDAGCNVDDIALVRYLLSDTKLRIIVKRIKSKEFEISIGSGQGDSLSGKLFVLYLARALKLLRATLPRPNPPINDDLMPLESEYVDD